MEKSFLLKNKFTYLIIWVLALHSFSNLFGQEYIGTNYGKVTKEQEEKGKHEILKYGEHQRGVWGQTPYLC